MQNTIRYNDKADAELNDLYRSVGAVNTQHKINVLEFRLQETSNFYALGGNLTDENKLGCLEHEYLGQKGLIELTLV